MATKHRHKRVKDIETKYKLLVAGSFILMCLIISLSIFSFIHQIQLNNDEFQTLDNQRVADFINTDISSINKPPAEDPMTGNLYIPEAHIVLPPDNPTIGAVAYAYYLNPSELHIISANDVLGAEEALSNKASQPIQSFYSQVPNLQACARGITIDFRPQIGKTIVYQKSLADQRIAYFYDESLCQDTTLLRYAEQLNSYALL